MRGAWGKLAWARGDADHITKPSCALSRTIPPATLHTPVNATLQKAFAENSQQFLLSNKVARTKYIRNVFVQATFPLRVNGERKGHDPRANVSEVLLQRGTDS